MNLSRPCRCNGLNASCVHCNGSGNLPDEGINIIPTYIDPEKKARQTREDANYRNGSEEKMYTSTWSPKKRKRKPKAEDARQINTDVNDPSYRVGPSNPNRAKLGDTRMLAFKKKPKK